MWDLEYIVAKKALPTVLHRLYYTVLCIFSLEVDHSDISVVFLCSAHAKYLLQVNYQR